MRRRGARGLGRPARRVMRRRRRRMRRRIIGGMVLIGGATAMYKLSKQDAQKIEEHTGVPPEELEDEDLQAAMNELGIQNQPVSEAEKAQMMADEQAEAASSPAGAPSSGPAPAQTDYISQLERLAVLRDQGIITDEEFEAKKRQLLGL